MSSINIKLIKYLKLFKNEDNKQSLFETIWNTYNKKIYYFSSRFSKNDAEDLMQEIMIKIFENIDNFNFSASFNTWIYTIAKNHCINFNKKLKNKKNISDPLTLKTIASDDKSPDIISINKLEYNLLNGKIGNLTPFLQQILFLRFNENLKYSEISKIMSISIGTIKKSIFLAKKKLKSLLGENYEI